MELNTLDHVALWTSERTQLAHVLVECCGMHEIERTERFTLVGGDARKGKLTLFDAAGPREQGVLERIVLRAPEPDDVRRRLESAGIGTQTNGMLTADLPSGLPLGVVAADGEVTDLDHVVLRVPDPQATAAGLAELGLEQEGVQLHVADKQVVLHEADAFEGARPLLNHLAFLVDAASDIALEARSRGIEIDDVVDAPNTRAVFLRGPDRIRLEYVEHKPGFSLV